MPPDAKVLVREQVGRRVRCVAPAVGWASMRDSDGVPILEPLESKAFGRWGRQRLHVGLCGHAVHFACWDTYFASLLGRAMAHQVEERGVGGGVPDSVTCDHLDIDCVGSMICEFDSFSLSNFVYPLHRNAHLFCGTPS